MGTEADALVHRVLRPPVRERSFWMIQGVVLVLATTHLFVDITTSLETGAFPGGVPVALLVIPIGYAALRYGLSGAVATGAWSVLLWLPDLLLPHDRGHVGSDLVTLAVVNLAAVFFGRVIEDQHRARDRAAAALREQLAAEARYRQLFDANGAPILVLDDHGVVGEANPAALALFGSTVLGEVGSQLLQAHRSGDGPVLSLADGRDYRPQVAPPVASAAGTLTQVLLADVTEERAERRRMRHYAQLVVQAEEEQRRRVALELHDEPLQEILHVARRLDELAPTPGAPAALLAGLQEARAQALEAAARLRGVARGLRPPALDQLGLLAALRSLLADLEDETGVRTRLLVAGTPTRLSPELELGAFRIAQEATRNALRHGGAQRISLSLRFASEAVGLEVEDDGCGFDLSSLDDERGSHLGVIGMRERAALLGGRLEMHAAPAAGTRVEAILPITSAAASEAPHSGAQAAMRR